MYVNFDITMATDLNFESHVFQNLHFSVKEGFFSFYSLNYYFTLDLILFYQIYHNFLSNPGFFSV